MFMCVVDGDIWTEAGGKLEPEIWVGDKGKAMLNQEYPRICRCLPP